MKKNNIEWYQSKVFILFVLVFIFFALVICIFPFTTIVLSKKWGGGVAQSGQIGDTIGGTMGPFIAIIASFLTFIAFWVQYQANEQQKKDLQIERFENKFYEMLHLHRANIEETKIVGASDVEKRKAFVSMYNELKYLYFYCELYYYKLLKERKIKKIKGNKNETKDILLNVAYTFFYIGVGTNSDHVNKIVLSRTDSKLYNALNNILKSVKIDHIESNYKSFLKNIEGNRIELNVRYTPFGGHMSRLGHYYRHLYQTVKFVDSNTNLTYEEKYTYIKMLRAQLSDHEQVLLYYNVTSKFGWRWMEEDNKFLIKYRMIHNAPIPLMNFGLNPKEHPIISKQIAEWESEHEKAFFEWDE